MKQTRSKHRHKWHVEQYNTNNLTYKKGVMGWQHTSTYIGNKLGFEAQKKLRDVLHFDAP